MASIMKLCLNIRPLASKNTGLLYNVVRTKVYTNDDFKPGPYPKTEQEKVAAAKKYGLSREEYEPYPDDGNGHGDYPKLPFVGAATRDPFYPWDNPALRRNVHEPLHIHDNVLGEDRIDAGMRRDFTPKKAIMSFFGFVGCLGLLAYWGMMDPMFPKVMEKQLPKPGDVHYTFEPAH